MSFRPVHEYVLGLFGVLGFFFHLIIPRANQYFFVFRPTPPFSSAPNKLAREAVEGRLLTAAWKRAPGRVL